MASIKVKLSALNTVHFSFATLPAGLLSVKIITPKISIAQSFAPAIFLSVYLALLSAKVTPKTVRVTPISATFRKFGPFYPVFAKTDALFSFLVYRSIFSITAFFYRSTSPLSKKSV
ncbi:MAG TPA: hypothetical protein PLN48_17055 [Lachnospiraceae bacterium]|nr:hypothetical protein [Lachnospiraceae bacterium]